MSTAPIGAAAATQAVLVALVALPYLGLAVARVRARVVGWTCATSSVWRALSLPFAILLGVVGWAASVRQPVAPYAAAYGGLLLLPALIAHAWSTRLTRPRGAHPWPLALVVLLALGLLLPVEFSLVPALPRLAPVGVSVAKFVVIASALWTFLVVHPMPRAGYGFAVDAASARTALVGFAAFSLVALPIGFSTGFLHWNPRPEAALWLFRPALIYFTIAVPEEFAFRGVVQRALTDRFGPRPGLLAASVVFGLAHAPSPVYVGLATLAGVAYGWVYQRTGRVAAAAVTHALVDAVWVLALRR